MRNFWDERYRQEEYAYGKEPNEFFREALDRLQLSGRILFPAEGEGRNAVYAAKNGLQVVAFDISEEARKKALLLADSEGVLIDYKVGAFEEQSLPPNSFDAVVLIFAHFSPRDQAFLYRQFGELVKPNGYIIIEGFSENNLNYRDREPGIGGPSKLEMLLSKKKIIDVYPNFAPILLEEKEVHLSEGLYHNGLASVIRFIGKKGQ